MAKRSTSWVYLISGLWALAVVGSSPAGAQFPLRASGCAWQKGFHVSGIAQNFNGAVFPYMVYASAVYDDGGGKQLYLAGSFRSADEAPANWIAKWDGESWSALPTEGQPLSVITSLTVWDDGSGPALYAATSQGIGRWDGSAWSVLPGPVVALDVQLTSGNVGSGPRLFAWSGTRIYQWNGASWSQMGGDAFAGEVRTVAVANVGGGNKLYAGGSFSQIGAVGVQRVAQWNGTQWVPMNAGLSGSAVNSLIGIGSRLYAGGAFADPTLANVASWNGSTWSPLGGSLNGEVQKLAAYDGGSGSILAAYGSFTMAGTAPADKLAIWSGAAWTGLAIPPEAQPLGIAGIRTLVQYDESGGTALFAAGQLQRDGGRNRFNALRWRAGQWSPVTGAPGGLGLDGVVGASAVQPDGEGRGLYVYLRNQVPGPGGLGPTYQQWMMKFDGTQWTTLPSTPNNVDTLKSFDDGNGPTLYAAQTTSTINGNFATITRWDGENWSSIGGTQRRIRAMEAFDDGNGNALYAAGQTLSAPAGAPTNFVSNIAKWDGSAWSAVGVGIFQPILALAVYDDGNGPALYAAGEFTQIGNSSPVAAGRIAKWDGTAWSPVGGAGLDGRVEKMAVWNDGGGNALYVVGQFTTAGGVPAPGIAKWNGSAWSAVGGGASSISEIVVFDDGAGSALYVDGDFTSIGGQPIATTARWDGSAWTPVGDGAGPRAQMHVFDSGAGPALYFTGFFLEAGGLAAYNAAQYCRPGVFADGFESGFPDAWSEVFP